MDDTLVLHTQIVHVSPGRLRLRLHPNGTPPRPRQIEHALGSLPGVQAVHVNPLVRSIVITFDAGTTNSDNLLGAIERLGVIVGRTLEASDEGRISRPLGDLIATFFQNRDRRVLENSGGFVDLRTLVPVGLGALALREILAGRMGTAPGYVLAWYAFDAFLKLRKVDSTDDGRVKR
jgi:hypothetical protein